MALVMTIGIMTVLAIAGTTVTYYATSNSGQSARSKAAQNAYTLAESGVNNASSVIFNPANNPLNPYLLCNTGESFPCAAKTATYDGGTVKWTGTLDQTTNPPVWTFTGTGSSRNPAVPAGNATHSTTVRVRVIPVYTEIVSANQVWNYIYVYGTNDPSGCDYSQSNNSAMGSPLYVAGNACFDNQAWISGGPLQIHGTLTLNSPQNKVGVSVLQPITSGVHIAGGCKLKPSLLFHMPCDATDNVYASPAADTSPITLEPPAPDWTTWYLNSSPGPYYPCLTESGTPPTFDGDQGPENNPNATKLNRSVAGTFVLTPSSSYTCKTANGELSWNASTKVLTVNGTVFIDGNARVDSGGVVSYTGMGSLYLSGSFVLKNTNLCAVVSGSSCDWQLGSGHWDPNSRFLNIVTGYIGGGGQADTPSSDTSIEITSSGYQGGMLAAQRLDVGSSSTLMGPLVANKLSVAQSITTYAFPTITTVPVATPGGVPKFANPQPPENYSG
jgi:Tfp pilus assembly protein PilX